MSVPSDRRHGGGLSLNAAVKHKVISAVRQGRGIRLSTRMGAGDTEIEFTADDGVLGTSTGNAIVRIGTRGSPLALAQAYLTQRLLRETFPELADEGKVEICVINTTGDRTLSQPLADIGGKGLFTKEIDVALLNDEINIAVHSTKDVPTYLAPGIVLPCMLEREDTRDAFICRKPGINSLEDLPQGAVIGSAALRRQAQINHRRPDLKVVNFRGNVQTRLRKLDEGEVDATLLAYAGLRRMDMEANVTQLLAEDQMIPAIAQGAISIACREGDGDMMKYLAGLNHSDTLVCVNTEREFLRNLDGSCRTPIAGHAKKNADGKMSFVGMVATPDGQMLYTTERTCDFSEAAGKAMAEDAANELRERAGKEFFEMIKESPTYLPAPENRG